MKQPPRDESGDVVPHDHSEIRDSDRIIRRISPEHVVSDASTAAGRRISSMAFRSSTRGNRGMSVDLAASILKAGLQPDRFVTQPPFVGSVWFTAGHLRSESFLVGYDPLPSNPHHGEVWGFFTKSKQKRLLAAAAWLVAIVGVDLHGSATGTAALD